MEQAKKCAHVLGFPDSLANVVYEQLSKMVMNDFEKKEMMLFLWNYRLKVYD